MDTTAFIPFIERLAHASAEAILPHFGNPFLGVDAKADDSPVTIADKQAEAIMRDLIATHFPSHGILGEEHGNENLDAEFVWILDPIDGTKSFITGVPLFTTLIGLLYQGKPILGAIHQPVLKQLCLGDNKHAWLNGKPISARSRTLAQSTLLISDPYSLGQFQNPAGWERLVRSTKLHRSWGDGYGYMLLARGFADIMCDPVLEPWDILPVVPVVQGAGAKITDWAGNPVTFSPGRCTRSAVAAHPELHAAVVATLQA